jgi:hypothetical protein
VSHSYLFPGLELAIRAYANILAKVPAERWDDRTEPGRFSLREAIAHLADWEPIMRERMRVAVENSGGEVEAHDEGQRAIDQKYAETDPLEQLEILRRERASTIQFLKVNGHDNWDKFVMHSERGKMTLYDQANLLLGHDLYHIEHLTQYL